jgi:hypothetical protein
MPYGLLEISALLQNFQPIFVELQGIHRIRRCVEDLRDDIKHFMESLGEPNRIPRYRIVRPPQLIILIARSEVPLRLMALVLILSARGWHG